MHSQIGIATQLSESQHVDSRKLQEFHRIFDPLEAEIVRAIWRVTRESDAAEEAFQIAMLSVWQRQAAVHDHPNPRALVLRICIDSAWYVRRQRSKLPKMVANYPLENIGDKTLGISHRLAMRELSQDLLRAIEALPEQQSICVWLRFVEEWRTSEIAATLGISEPTVRKHIERARKRMAFSLRTHLRID